MIDPATDIDAGVKAGPTEFGRRRRLKMDDSVLKGKSAAQTGQAAVATAMQIKIFAKKFPPWGMRTEIGGRDCELQSGVAAHVGSLQLPRFCWQ